MVITGTGTAEAKKVGQLIIKIKDDFTRFTEPEDKQNNISFKLIELARGLVHKLTPSQFTIAVQYL